MGVTISWVRGVDKQDSTCIMEFLLYTINNNLMLSQNIPFHHKMIIYLNTKMFFLFVYAYTEICRRENKDSFILSATSYLLWPPLLIVYNASHFDMSSVGHFPSRFTNSRYYLSFLASFDDSLQLENSHCVFRCHFYLFTFWWWHVKSKY